MAGADASNLATDVATRRQGCRVGRVGTWWIAVALTAAGCGWVLPDPGADGGATNRPSDRRDPTDVIEAPEADAGCAASSTECEGQCVDTAIDVRNCGGCGIECPQGIHARRYCSQGQCAFECEQGYANCSGAAGAGCPDLIGERSSCGRCASTHACAASGEQCISLVSVADAGNGFGCCRPVDACPSCTAPEVCAETAGARWCCQM